MLGEASLAEWMQAEAAGEVLGVVLAPQGGDAAAGDGLLAAPAQHPLPGVEVQRTEGTSLQLHEAASGEGLQAVPLAGTEAIHSFSWESDTQLFESPLGWI